MGRKDNACYNHFYDSLLLLNGELKAGHDYIEITNRPNEVRRRLKEHVEFKNGKFLNLSTASLKNGELGNGENELSINVLEDFEEYSDMRRYFLISGMAIKRIGMSYNSIAGAKIRDYFMQLDMIASEYNQYLKTVRENKQRIRDNELEQRQLANEKEIARLHLVDVLRNEHPNDITFKHKKGKIYIVTTPSRERYNIYKIGITTDIKMRMVLFNANQPENDQFKCIYLRDCSKIEAVEAAVKQDLAPFRIKKNPNSEMVRVNLAHIEYTINRHIDLCEAIDVATTKVITTYDAIHNRENENIAAAIDVSKIVPDVNEIDAQIENNSGKSSLMSMTNAEIDNNIVCIMTELARRELKNETFEFTKPSDLPLCTLCWPDVSEMITRMYNIEGKAIVVKKRVATLMTNSNIKFNSSGQLRLG